MRFSLIPREEKFFDMFDDVAAIISRAAGRFLEMVTQYELRMEERECDDGVGKIIKALDRSFITPFDREDIHTLATKLDDIMDNMEETAHRFEVFRIEKPTAPAIALARIIQEACLHLEHAIRACRTLKYPKVVQDHLKEITRLENEADNIRTGAGVRLSEWVS